VLVLRAERKENDMKKSYAKSLPEYNEPFELDAEKILAAMKRYKDSKKKPTSIALDEKTIAELKKEAGKKEIPYQTLMRVLILDGLARLKRAA
jgi:predicted DNA binding CopG/RHH family protein